jgi:hypothetical protein
LNSAKIWSSGTAASVPDSENASLRKEPVRKTGTCVSLELEGAGEKRISRKNRHPNLNRVSQIHGT